MSFSQVTVRIQLLPTTTSYHHSTLVSSSLSWGGWCKWQFMFAPGTKCLRSMIFPRAGYSSFSSPMGLLGGLVHSELYTDTTCCCYYRAAQGIRSVVAMVAPTPFLSLQWSWQPTVMRYQSENNQSALTRHLFTFILDCYWVAHVSMCVLSWWHIRAPPPEWWASPSTGSWWMESVCWKRRIPDGQFL